VSRPAFEDLANELDVAIAAVDSLPEPARTKAKNATEALERFFSEAVAQQVRILRDQVEGGSAALAALAADPLVRTLFLATGVLRPGPTERAERALDLVRPYVRSHWGEVELVRVEPPVAYLRFKGACDGCVGSLSSLEDVVGQAILAAVAEVERIEVMDAAAVVGDRDAPVAMSATRRHGGTWLEGPRFEDVPAPGVLAWRAGERNLLIVSHQGSVSCFENACAHLGMPLDRATVGSDGTLRCPWHGFTYDARTGESLNLPGVQLLSYEARVTAGRVMIRLERR
jgi:nitrite reductase/ring-hydroxylating ferredoxin subunit/Fe-S cluster biogenesis protein NfuA